MKLRRFLLRYYPPAIILKASKADGTEITKEIPLLHLDADIDGTLPADFWVPSRRCKVRAKQVKTPLRRLTPPIPPSVEVLINQIIYEEPLISSKRKPQLRKLIYKLIEKLEANEAQDFYLFKILRAHILPLTNCAFNKSGDMFITGSYDRTVRWGCGTIALSEANRSHPFAQHSLSLTYHR